MMQVGVFVDAGYVYAAGGVAIAGQTRARLELALDVPVVVERLKSVIAARAPLCRLLRIYWYDGALANGRPTAEQALIASCDDVKLRLGHVNSRGEQKEVDSFIVTDLIELARANSISDAVVLAGDGDLRIGVAIAQTYGVRIHLLGIDPVARNQSPQLREEADTKSNWTVADVSKFLSLRKVTATSVPIGSISESTANTGVQDSTASAIIVKAVTAYVATMSSGDWGAVVAYWREGNRGIPNELDKILLVQCGHSLGRNLTNSETKIMRSTLKKTVSSKTT